LDEEKMLGAEELRASLVGVLNAGWTVYAGRTGRIEITRIKAGIAAVVLQLLHNMTETVLMAECSRFRPMDQILGT
jgi:hypothetical protein